MNNAARHSEILEGDCLEVMRTLPDACFDSVVTDPPYGLSFMGKEWDHGVPGAPFWAEALRVAKPGAMLLAFGGTRTFHRLACAIEDAGWEVRDCLSWMYGQGFPKSLDISKAIDKAAGAERTEILRSGVGYEAAPDRNTFAHGLNAGFRPRELRAPVTEEAKAWTGWGTALKPAWEPIILAMKPTDGTFAANALAHGVAGLNVDGCRIGAGKPRPSIDSERRGRGEDIDFSAGSRAAGVTTTGRWPANVVLDEEAGALLDEQSGIQKDGIAVNRNRGKVKPSVVGFTSGHSGKDEGYGGGGGASRFFYCAKASRADRGAGNAHPTVKPIELMRWLVRLCATPTGGAVLDPFCGSGSTGVACALEGRDFLGIEREAQYVEIARARIEAAR